MAPVAIEVGYVEIDLPRINFTAGAVASDRREKTIRAWARSHRGRRLASLRRRARSRRGVSDVVGTILLLALTVTLFSSIFLFVDAFPQPPPQPASQFSAQLLYNNTKITAVSIVHLSGPTLSGSNVLVYLYSSAHPTRFTGPFSLSAGLNGSKAWNLGQAWYLNLTSYTLTVPDQITVSIISTTQLLFRITLPGSNPILPPQFVASGTAPASPSINQAFTLYVQIVDPALKNYSVYANVSAVPGSGLPPTDKMSYAASTGQYTLSFPSGASVIGTFYVFVNASDTKGQTNTLAVPIVVSVGSNGVPPSGVSITVSPLPVVNATAETIYATVANTGPATAGVSATFYAGATQLGSASGTVSAGGSTTLSQAWTPSSMGTATITVFANVTGGGSPTGTYNVTVFPRMLLLAHGALAGSQATNNTSAYLAEQIKAAGFPFTSMFVACNVAMPAATTFELYDLVVIDFGSSNSGACDATPSTTEQAKITTAMSVAPFTNFLLVGASFLAATACTSYSATLIADFGITGPSGTCTATTTSASTAATYTAVAAKGFRADGVGALTINKTLAGSAAFVPIGYFTQGGTNTFLSTAGHTVGTFTHVAQRGRGAIIGTDPALIMSTLPAPASSAWGIGPGGTQVVYNVLNYLARFSSSAATGRAFPDYAVSGAQIVGLSASHLSSVYVTLRDNGAVGGLVSVSLTVNGSVALYGGAPVTSVVFVSPNGLNVTVVLTWEAPTIGPYNLGVVASSVQGNLYGSLAQLPLNILNRATVFTA